ncbi:MAG: Ig-like domain-containing protein [Lachnospiraceae bacterium]|nr:Ig-like domain-containing protein [Lachnospiraceae bacterium]
MDNEDRYLLLPDDDYVIEYIGNDEGVMTCDVGEYEDNELVRSLTYENIPLSKDQKYSSFLEAGRRQGLALYNLNSEEGERITASTAQGFERKEVKAETLSLDQETLELEIGESYTLQEAMEPYNTTESQVTWKSSDDRIVSVDEDGTVTALGKGQVQITAKGQSGNLSAVCQVTVPRTPILPSASVSPTVLPTRMPDAADCPDSTGTPSPSAAGYPDSTGTPSPSAAVRPAVTASIPPKTTVSSTKAPKAPVVTQTLRKGQVFKDAKTKAYYKILSVTAAGGKATYLHPVGKKVKKVTIKDTVIRKGKKFKVTQLGNKAFKDCKKLQKVTVGKNVSVIGKKAFANCRSLKVVILTGPKQKLPKNAFAGCPAKPKVRKKH